ncbi:porin [Amantichitinum ursilacus]|uniref:Gram-negative porin n=1 Tax=Amantichitinum ursilacus TaxID=857265 RepID=A0A0N1JTT8_9NEIS|nr:porin [Amantichitinum ursilacus]KPC55204.1 Gram-negative porin [Amantichitinum ursilacus]
MKKVDCCNLKTMLIIGASVFAGISGLAAAADLGTATIGDLKIETKVYGFLNAQIESVKADGGATPYDSRGRVSDGNSRLGFSGAIPVNATTKAVWQLEGGLNNFENGGVNDQGSSATLESRNSFVGIDDTRFGRLIAGNNDSAYRSLVGSGGLLGGNLGLTVNGLDVFNNTTAQMTGNANSIFSRGESRMKNSVHYFSPDFKGLQLAGSYGFDEAQSSGSNRERYSLAAKYSYSGFQLGLGYDRQANTGVLVDNIAKGTGFSTGAVNNVNTSFYKAVASYTFPTKTYLGVGVERGSYGYNSHNAEGSMKQDGWMISAAQDLRDDVSVKVAYARLGGLSNALTGSSDDYGARQFAIGAQYNFNRYIATYVYYTEIRNEALQSVDLGQAPIYSNNAGTSSAYLAPGDSPRALGVGLIARF